MAAYSPQELDLKLRCQRLDLILHRGEKVLLTETFLDNHPRHLIISRYIDLGHRITYDAGFTIIHPLNPSLVNTSPTISIPNNTDI